MNMVSNQLVYDIAAVVSKDNLIVELDNITSYMNELGVVPDFSPRLIVYAENESQVSAIVRIAGSNGIGIIPRGSGRSLAARSNVFADTMILDLRKMNRIVEIDDKNQTAAVQPGVLLNDLKKRLEEKNLYLPPDVDTLEPVTMGGILAANAGGLRSLKYGSFVDYVMGIRLVTATGEVFSTGKKAIKDVAGYNLAKFVVGSRGTLGIITEALLKVLPLPRKRSILVASFISIQDMIDAASAIISRKQMPSMMQFMDVAALRRSSIQTPFKIPSNSSYLLLIEADGYPSAVDDDLSLCREACNEKHAITVERIDDDADINTILDIRKGLLSDIFRSSPGVVVIEVVSPRSRIPGILTAASAGIAAPDCIFSLGHTARGSFYLVYCLEETGSDNKSRIHKTVEEIIATVQNAGGGWEIVLTQGIKPSDLPSPEIPEQDLEIVRNLKHSLDPQNIFNPGLI